MAVDTQINLKQEVLRVLERHVGRENPIKANELSRMFGYSKTNTWVIRDAIHELVIDDKNPCPICAAQSRPEGYFIAETYQEVNDYAQTLKDRGIADIIRRRDVRRAAQRYFEGTVKLL